MAGLALPYLLPEIKDPELQFKKYLNFLLALLYRRENALIVRSKPFDISINPSTACQLNCPGCKTGTGAMTRPPVHLTPELHRRMISDAADELFIIRYFGTGESLLNRKFPELLKQVEGKEVFTFITTNLSFPMKDEQIDELLLSGLHLIGVSLDGADQETYGRYRVGGVHEQVVANLRRLIERKKQLGLQRPLIEWRYLVFKHNEHEIPRVRELAGDYGVDLLEFVPGSAPKNSGAVQMVDRFDARPTLSGPALKEAMLQKRTPLRKLIARRTFEQKLPSNDMKFRKCDWHYVGSYWYPDGGVGPCCHPTSVDEDFGTITAEQSFGSVWNDARYQDARALVRGEKKAVPDNFCSRCPGKAIMDRFFVTTVRGILLNAPPWVLKIASRGADQLFFPIDHHLLYQELQTILDSGKEFAGSDGGIRERMEAVSRNAGPNGHHIARLLELLA